MKFDIMAALAAARPADLDRVPDTRRRALDIAAATTAAAAATAATTAATTTAAGRNGPATDGMAEDGTAADAVMNRAARAPQAGNAGSGNAAPGDVALGNAASGNVAPGAPAARSGAPARARNDAAARGAAAPRAARARRRALGWSAVAGSVVAAGAAVAIGLSVAPGTPAQKPTAGPGRYWLSEIASYGQGIFARNGHEYSAPTTCYADIWTPRSPSDRAWLGLRVVTGTAARVPHAATDRGTPATPYCSLSYGGTAMLFDPSVAKNTKPAIAAPGRDQTAPVALNVLGGVVGGQVTVDQIMHLPTAPAELEAAIEGWMGHDAVSVIQCMGQKRVPESYCRQEGLFQVAEALLPTLPTTPGVRTAFYRMLSSLPVTSKHVRDPRGRAGVALTLKPPNGYAADMFPDRTTLVFDPVTHALLAETNSDGYTVVLHQGWTNTEH